MNAVIVGRSGDAPHIVTRAPATCSATFPGRRVPIHADFGMPVLSVAGREHFTFSREALRSGEPPQADGGGQSPAIRLAREVHFRLADSRSACIAR